MSTTTDPRKILEVVLAVQLRDEDGGRPTVADVLPDDLAKQAKAAVEGWIDIPSLVTCRACRKAFIPGRGTKITDTLPCGHTGDAWMAATYIVDAEEMTSKRRL